MLERLIVSAYQIRFQNSFFTFESGLQTVQVSVNDIVFLETAERRVKITLTNGTHTCSGKLTELLAELPKGRFVRCHQSFVVNVGNIRAITIMKVVTVNGQELPISRAHMKDIKDAFLRSIQDIY